MLFFFNNFKFYCRAEQAMGYEKKPDHDRIEKTKNLSIEII